MSTLHELGRELEALTGCDGAALHVRRIADELSRVQSDTTALLMTLGAANDR